MSLPTAAADYHRDTSYRRHHMTPHRLDWAHQPLPVKSYPDLPRVPLARGTESPPIDYVDLSNHDFGGARADVAAPDMRGVATLLRLTHDITARTMHAGRPFYYRSVASAGALYPIELYLAANGVDGLTPGVYYHDLFDSSLVELRQGPVSAIPPVARGVAASIYITGIFFRSAWKYRLRAYRYVLMDAGHLFENLRLALGALDQPFSVHLDFDDQQIATLLGLDMRREVCLACVHLHGDGAGGRVHTANEGPAALGESILGASVVSAKEVAYAGIDTVHRAGNRVAGESVETIPASYGRPYPALPWIDLSPPARPMPADYTAVLERRRSRRNFIPEAVSRDDFMAFMDLMARHMGPSSAMPPACRAALNTGILAGTGMPMPAGYYLLDSQARRLGCVLEGRLMESMAAACLDQMWLKHAAFHLLFMADLSGLDRIWGARGYRYAMIEAGRLGQQAYLAATALGWGACGIGAIYDRDAANLLKLVDDQALLYLVGVGPVKRS